MAILGVTTIAGGDGVPFFEGTEKRIEVDFVGEGDLRKVPRSAWEEVIRLSGTQILHQRDTTAFTSFLLSESSLLIYPHKVVLKTCGRTVPICGVPRVLELAEGQGLEPEWLCYSRKNFLAPSAQPLHHQSKEAEIALCHHVCRGVGDGYVLGPMTGEHWLVYDAQFKVDKAAKCTERGDFQIDIMMYGLPKDVRELFTSDLEGNAEAATAMTRASGLADVVALLGGEVDDYVFAPCGYSCNVHAGNAYAMVHVTPQENCSYASFETNFGSTIKGGKPEPDTGKKLDVLVGKVLDAFRPNRLTITLFSDQGAVDVLGPSPFTAADRRYRRRNLTLTHFEQDYMATIVNYEIRDKKRSRDEIEGSNRASQGTKRAASDGSAEAA